MFSAPKPLKQTGKYLSKRKKKKLSDVLEELLAPFGINYKIVKDRIVLYRPKAMGFIFNSAAEDNELVVSLETADKEIKGQITDDKGSPWPV